MKNSAHDFTRSKSFKQICDVFSFACQKSRKSYFSLKKSHSNTPQIHHLKFFFGPKMPKIKKNSQNIHKIPKSLHIVFSSLHLISSSFTSKALKLNYYFLYRGQLFFCRDLVTQMGGARFGIVPILLLKYFYARFSEGARKLLTRASQVIYQKYASSRKCAVICKLLLLLPSRPYLKSSIYYYES